MNYELRRNYLNACQIILLSIRSENHFFIFTLHVLYLNYSRLTSPPKNLTHFDLVCTLDGEKFVCEIKVIEHGIQVACVLSIWMLSKTPV